MKVKNIPDFSLIKAAVTGFWGFLALTADGSTPELLSMAEYPQKPEMDRKATHALVTRCTN